MAPAIGGAIVGMIAFVSPQVLASGHGALHLDLNANLTIPVLLLLIFSKSLASAISIGSGFRGGLFFASLFLGALTGKLFAAVTGMVLPLSLEPEVYAVIGMSSMAVAIVGGPLTMAFLALELTGDFPIAMLVLGPSFHHHLWSERLSATRLQPGASICVAKLFALHMILAGFAISRSTA